MRIGVPNDKKSHFSWPGGRACHGGIGACRQLGVELHELGRALPIFDGETGAPVPPETDARIEVLVNHLLDAAREGVDDADDAEPARPDTSLGAALDGALAAHLAGPARFAEQLAEARAGGAAAGAPTASRPQPTEALGGGSAPAAESAERRPGGGAGAEAAGGAEPAASGPAAVCDRVDPRLAAAAGGGGAAAHPPAKLGAPVAGAGPEAESTSAAPQSALASLAEQVCTAADSLVTATAPDELKATPVPAAADVPVATPATAGQAEAASGSVPAPAAAGPAGAAEGGGAADTELAAASDGAPASADAEADALCGPGAASADQGTRPASPEREPVPPAAGVSGKELGEATTAAAEAVALERERALEAGVSGAAAAAAGAAVAGVELPHSLSEAERRLLDWHWANLEYGCSARLDQARPGRAAPPLPSCRRDRACSSVFRFCACQAFVRGPGCRILRVACVVQGTHDWLTLSGDRAKVAAPRRALPGVAGALEPGRRVRRLWRPARHGARRLQRPAGAAGGAPGRAAGRARRVHRRHRRGRARDHGCRRARCCAPAAWQPAH